MVGDATFPDTYVPSYSTLATIEAGAVPARAEAGKRLIYRHLDPNHLFEPDAIEISVAFGPSTMEFLEELDIRLNRVVGDANARYYLYQRLSMAVQRGNAASIMGTISPSSDFADFFFFLVLFIFIFIWSVLLCFWFSCLLLLLL